MPQVRPEVEVSPAEEAEAAGNWRGFHDKRSDLQNRKDETMDNIRIGEKMYQLAIELIQRG